MSSAPLCFWASDVFNQTALINSRRLIADPVIDEAGELGVHQGGPRSPFAFGFRLQHPPRHGDPTKAAFSVERTVSHASVTESHLRNKTQRRPRHQAC
ncbi:hypothetical protein DPEC_G00320120 [Dallia pectoralis]|uniref:Uncharacterized protein n=1 Tax=Dallia pectoralis TaxID=75939 RepID=A0ACC2F9Z0_DALPE|nr:hypothetical protein DPEC_G00320120 [Dallia pectoralis]